VTAGLDLDALTAIDMHVPRRGLQQRPARRCPVSLEAASSAYFKIADPRRPTLGEIAAHLPRAAAGLRGVHGGRPRPRGGQPPVPNEEVAEAGRPSTPTWIIPFASIDPGPGAARRAPAQARRLVTGHWRPRLQVPPQRAGVFFPQTTGPPTASTKRSRNSACPPSSTTGPDPASGRAPRVGGGHPAQVPPTRC